MILLDTDEISRTSMAEEDSSSNAMDTRSESSVNAMPMAVTIISPAWLKSKVWEHFGFPRPKDLSASTAISANNWKDLLKLSTTVCKICQYQLPYKTGNTTDMTIHLRRYHSIDVDASCKRKASDALGDCGSSRNQVQLTLKQCINKGTVWKSDSIESKNVLAAIADYVVKDVEPLSVVEGEGFRRLMSVATQGKFKMLSRPYVTETVLPEKFVKLQCEVNLSLKEA